MMGEERRSSFMTEVLSYRNQSIGFYMTGTAVMKELILCYLYVFIKIYYLIMTKIINISASKYSRKMLLVNP